MQQQQQIERKFRRKKLCVNATCLLRLIFRKNYLKETFQLFMKLLLYQFCASAFALIVRCNKLRSEFWRKKS